MFASIVDNIGKVMAEGEKPPKKSTLSTGS